MRIGFDMRPFLKEETGVGIYFKNLLFHLAQIDSSNEYYLFSSSYKDRFPPQKVPPFVKRHFRDFRIPVKVVNFFWYTLSWPLLDRFFRTELDLTHSATPLILPTKGRKIVTVHDLFFIDFPHMTDRETRKNFVNKIKDSLLKSDRIVAVSHFTKNVLLERFPLEGEKVKVIYHGLDSRFATDISPEEVGEIRQKYSLPSSFVLFVGAVESRKNILNLIEALKIIHQKYGKIPLLIVGRTGSESKDLERKVRKEKLKTWVKIMGYLPDEEVRVFYRLASIFALPSFCEGFGFPLLEAMASNLPIAASQAPAIPEIAQDAALYFNPKNPEDMADKIILVLKDESIRRNLIAEGRKRLLDFDWKRTARETLNLYKDVIGRSPV
jgi:glycosyltransferase involved in cell wall biosynthesis